MPRCMRYLAAAVPSTSSINESPGSIWLQPVLLRLLVTWLVDCPLAVSSFLDPPAHLPFLVDLTASSGSLASVHVAGLAAVLLGACIIFNSEQGTKDATVVVDIISQRVGLTNYFSKWEEMEKSSLFVSATSASRLPKPLTRLTAAAAAAGDGMISIPSDHQQQVQSFSNENLLEPLVTTFYDAEFVVFIKQLEPVVRERIVDIFAHPKSRVMVDTLGFEPQKGETDNDYIQRLRTSLQNQAQEMQVSPNGYKTKLLNILTVNCLEVCRERILFWVCSLGFFVGHLFLMKFF